MNPAMPRLCFETRAAKGGIWIQREKNRRRKLEKKQQRMRNTLSGGEGEFSNTAPTLKKTTEGYYDHIKNLNLSCSYFFCMILKSTCVYRLAQGQMHQQKLEDALHEAQKPMARHRDDEDLDRMLREQEREGDPMAAMLRRKKARSTKTGIQHCTHAPWSLI